MVVMAFSILSATDHGVKLGLFVHVSLEISHGSVNQAAFIVIPTIEAPASPDLNIGMVDLKSKNFTVEVLLPDFQNVLDPFLPPRKGQAFDLPSAFVWLFLPNQAEAIAVFFPHAFAWAPSVDLAVSAKGRITHEFFFVVTLARLNRADKIHKKIWRIQPFILADFKADRASVAEGVKRADLFWLFHF
jgi:hypothetical protein